MNKDLKNEELDRELSINERATGSIYDAVKVNVNSKNITFTSHHHENPSNTEYQLPYIHKTK